MRLNFTSNSKITGRGFKLRWQAECGTTFQTSHGVVMSPYYPQYYPNENFECKYFIDPESENNVQIITIRVVDVDLDTTMVSNTRVCSSDYLEIIDVTQNQVLLTICGETLGYSDVSSPLSIKGPVGVRFVSNASMLHDYTQKRKNHRGFKITYALSDCGGEINLARTHNKLAGTINSPGYPLHYHDELDCVWNISAPDGYVIAIKLTGVDIETSPNCTFDYLEIFDGPTMENGTSFGRLCGPQAPEGHRRTSGNNAVLRFVTDRSRTSGGFMAVLTATLGPENGCGGQLLAKNESQKLNSPYDKETKSYYNNLRCMWKISTTSDQIIEVKLTQFDMEKRYRNNLTSDCYDFMAIYDGPASISPFLMKPICELPRDLEFPIYFYSSFHSVDVYFETDYSEAFGGFELEYRTMNDDCGGVFKAYSTPGEIDYESTRTATRTNQRQKRCRFFIKGSENEPIELNFLHFNFPSKTNDCMDEYLEIRDVGTVAECEHPACAQIQSAAKNDIRTCGRTAPSRFVSRTSLVQIVTSVVLQSQYTASFSLEYKLLDSCNRTIDIKTGVERWASGHITSPNYPNKYDHNMTCITKIRVPEGKKIFLAFQSFSMERGNTFRSSYSPIGLGYRRYNSQFRFQPACQFDNLTIIYNETNPTQNETFCGWSSPPARLSPENTIMLNFTTDGNYVYSGYKAFYYTVTIENDGEYRKFYNFAPIYDKEGYISNIGFPGYDQNTTQRWTIIPPAGMTCAVKIIPYMSRTLNCNPNEKAKWAHYLGEAPDRWIDLPCYDSYPHTSMNLTAGEKMMFELTTDEYAYNNGFGIRVFWTCVTGTPVFLVDDWEQATTN